MAEETVTLSFSDNASAPAGVAASALDRVDKALDKLEGKEVDVKTGKLSEASIALNRLRDTAARAGSAMALAMNGVSPAAAGASAAGTKLSSVFDLLKKRADAFKSAEAAAFADMEKRANRLPTALQPGAAPKEQSGFQKLVGLVGKVFGQDAAGGLVRGAAFLSQASDKLGVMGPVLLQGGKLLAVGAVAITAAGIALAAALVFGAAKLIQAGFALSVAATSTRESFEASVKRFVGGAAEAHEAYASAIKVAIELSLDKDETLRKAKELAGVGFRGAEIEVILRARADIATSSEEKANAFQKLLEKLKSGKQFNQESLNALTEAGINSDAVLAQLAKKLGVKVDRVKELLKAGKVDVQTGMNAIIAAAQGQYGGAAGNAADTVPAKLQSLKTLFESMFDNVDLSGVKAALDSVMKIFDGPDGEKFKAAVNKLFGTISKIVGEAFSGPEGEARLKRFITGVTKLMEGAATLIEAAGPRIIKVIDAISKLVDRNGSSTGGSWLQSIVTGIAGLSDALLGTDISGSLQSIFSAFDDVAQFQTKAFTLGENIVRGLINGLLSLAGTVASTMVQIVSGGIGAGNSAAQTHSPSKLTTDTGANIGEGYVVGAMSKLGRVADAGSSLAAAALGGPANDNATPAAASSGGGTGGVTIHVHVTAGAGVTREQAQAAGDAAGEAAYQAWRRDMARFVRDERRAA